MIHLLKIALIMGFGTGISAPAQIMAATPQPEKAMKQMPATEPMTIETPAGRIYGTLTLPKTTKAVPVAIIIPGSGPTNRDGNSPAIPGANNSLKYLAEGLATHNIASLRFDKRGVGESVKALAKEEDIRFEHFIEDVISWGNTLKSDKRFSSLVIIGHSEGSLIGMVAAQKLKASAYVSLAGAGRPISAVLLDQLRPALSADLFAQSEKILKELSAGNTVRDVPATLAMLFRPSVQPYMISWLKYNPAEELARLAIPILIIQGTTDIQVRVEEAKALSQAQPAAKLLIVEGMNHLLKEVPADREKQMKSYGDPELPVMPLLVNEISSFIKASKAARIKTAAARAPGKN